MKAWFLLAFFLGTADEKPGVVGMQQQFQSQAACLAEMVVHKPEATEADMPVGMVCVEGFTGVTKLAPSKGWFK